MSVQGAGLVTGGGAVNKLPQVTDGSITELTESDLYGATQIKAYSFRGRMHLQSVVIPSTVTSIGDYAFYDCTSLSSIEISSGATSISSYAFNNCQGLTSVVFPDTMESIGYCSFGACHNLSSVVIGTGITSIGMSTFSNCSRLSSVTVKATTPPALTNTGVFSGTSADLVIYVPAASVDTYKGATNWSTYADKIQAIPS